MEVTRPILLSLVFEALGIVSIDSTREKRIMQKMMYLLQAFGVNLLYGFCWEIYGPYSVELSDEAKELFQRKDEYDKIFEEQGFYFSEETASKLSRFMERIGDKVRQDLDYGDLLASIDFVNNMFSNKAKAKDLARSFAERQGKEFLIRFDREFEELSKIEIWDGNRKSN